MTLDELRGLAEPTEAGHLFPPPYRMMAPSLEECELLHALVLAVRPQCVLELGRGYGVTARFIAEALKANGTGTLYSVEPDHQYADSCLPLLGDLLGDWIELDDEPLDPDIVFIDSGWKRRERDILEWLGPDAGPMPSTLVVLHDAERGYDLHGADGVYLPSTSGLWLGRAA